MEQPNSLGLMKAPSDTRVVVAMSGGVDSSVVAVMLHQQGYEVIGMTMQLYDHGQAIQKKGACCAGQDIYDARRIADQFGFAHYILDYESRFRDAVIDDFADAYLRGETPIPCIRCNQTVKFNDMFAMAKSLNADILATGHYVQSINGQLHCGVDPQKDQSYFLFATTAEQLEMLRFPLGGMDKAQTRALAVRYGLPVADKPDSQDICFVPDGNYAELVTKLRPHARLEGDIVHLDGRVLGRHQGIVNYTIGQRRGLQIGGLAEPVYVVGLDPERNRVLVGPQAALARSRVYVKELNWLADDLPRNPLDGSYTIQVKLRSAMQPCGARLQIFDDQHAQIDLDQALYGIAPGQAAVFYAGTRVLGGGWIQGSELCLEPLSANQAKELSPVGVH